MIRALPDILSSSMFSRVTSELRADLDRAALEAVTGKRADIIGAAGGKTGQIHRVQRIIDQSQSTQIRLSLASGRYDQAAVSFRTIRETTDQIGVSAMQAATAGTRTGIVAAADAGKAAEIFCDKMSQGF